MFRNFFRFTVSFRMQRTKVQKNTVIGHFLTSLEPLGNVNGLTFRGSSIFHRTFHHPTGFAMLRIHQSIKSHSFYLKKILVLDYLSFILFYDYCTFLKITLIIYLIFLKLIENVTNHCIIFSSCIMDYLEKINLVRSRYVYEETRCYISLNRSLLALKICK